MFIIFSFSRLFCTTRTVGGNYHINRPLQKWCRAVNLPNFITFSKWYRFYIYIEHCLETFIQVQKNTCTFQFLKASLHFNLPNLTVQLFSQLPTIFEVNVDQLPITSSKITVLYLLVHLVRAQNKEDRSRLPSKIHPHTERETENSEQQRRERPVCSIWTSNVAFPARLCLNIRWEEKERLSKQYPDNILNH